MRPATPKHPKHDSACPWCGEPLMAARFLGRRMGEYMCARCKAGFALIGDRYFDLHGGHLAAWVGDPLYGGQA
jgi:hypothetical protein